MAPHICHARVVALLKRFNFVFGNYFVVVVVAQRHCEAIRFVGRARALERMNELITSAVWSTFGVNAAGCCAEALRSTGFALCHYAERPPKI